MERSDDLAKSSARWMEWKQMRSLVGGVYYLTVSLLLSTLNKALMSKYEFKVPLFILLLQIVATLLIFGILLGLRWLPTPSRPPWKTLVLLTAAYFLNMASSMSAMNLTSLLMFNTLRRTSIVFVLFFERLLLNKTAPPTVLLAILVIVSGSLVAGYRDLSFDARGYTYAIVANLSTSSYIVLIKKAQVDSKLDSLQLLFYNSLIAIGPMALLSYFRGEFKVVHEFFTDTPDSGFLWALVGSALLGFFINHGVYYNTAVSSPLTHTVTAQIKDVLLLLVGYFVFDYADISRGTLVGAIISFLGSCFYGVIQYRSKTAKSRLKPQPEQSKTKSN